MAWTSRLAIAVLPALFLVCGSAHADPLTVRKAAFVGHAGQVAQPVVPCTCRFEGQDVLLGQTICIKGRQATCEKVLNNTSWKFSQKPCLFMSLAPQRAPQA
ncbi:MAG: hypothetical protein KDJ77_19085 [Rhodobiaceae bacterium]|nr:hypothetical protein [Rhodobiaceae bacterium]